MMKDDTSIQDPLLTCEISNATKSLNLQPSTFSLQSSSRRLWAMLAVLLCIAPLTTAETLLNELADRDFSVRERASEKLLTDELLNPHKIKKLFAQAQLPEQQHRLLNAALHHTLRQMRLETFQQEGNGAIGIRHEAFSATQFPDLDQAGLIVVETFPGFPGHARLRRGDLILAIGGQRFALNLSSDQVADRFVRMVQDHQAGEEIELSVRRDRRTIPVRLKLASLNALRAMYKNAQTLQKPYIDQWLSIRKTLVDSPPETLSVPVAPPQTVPPAEMPHQPTDRENKP